MPPRTTILFAILASALAPGTATSEVYRCTGPDGAIVFTDDPTACPDSRKHEPVGKVQTLPSEEDAAPAAIDPPASDDYAQQLENERAQKAHWQQKKRMKEEQLRELERREQQIAKFVSACNRGMEVITRDPSGMKHPLPCSRVREEFDEIRSLREPLRDYLETGLARECRRAGCLPGWIR